MALEEQEIQAFGWMQVRLVDLLLRYDEERFKAFYGELDSSEEKAKFFQPYRDLAIIFHLKDELFEHILPLIKRRLSFEAPGVTQEESLPARGKIDWVHTAKASWDEYPGETPFTVYTRQHRRHFATPANLLTVTTILEFSAGVQKMLDEQIIQGNLEYFRHPLNDIQDLCTRELAFLQFAGLVAECKEIISGYSHITPEALEIRVEETLVSGGNSAYSELLNWREKYANLQFLSRRFEEELKLTLGANPERDNYLYQLWLFFEIADLLRKKGRHLKTNFPKNLSLEFAWGEDGKEISYRLQHDQAILGMPSYWENGPGVRPDFYIERTDRNENEVRDGKVLIWREPGFVLDAKYYKPKESLKAPSSPVKRMIADLQLTSEKYGILLFAFQKHTQDNTDTENTAVDTLETAQGQVSQLYTIKPSPALAQYVQPDVSIGVSRFRPEMNRKDDYLDASIIELLNSVHAVLKNRIEVRCHGMFLDSLSANAHEKFNSATNLSQRDGSPLANSDDDFESMLLCPKPHIASWRVDLVNLEQDCLHSNLCHVKNLAKVKPSRITTMEFIEKAIRGNTEKIQDENIAAKVATQKVAVIARRYADFIKPNMNKYKDQLRKEIGPNFDTTNLLTNEQRETLYLSFFLEAQIKLVEADNFAGPALLLTGVLEEIARRQIYPFTSLHSLPEKEKNFGSLTYNRIRVQQDLLTANCWKEQISNQQQYRIRYWFDHLNNIRQIRNIAAHQAYIDNIKYEELYVAFFGSRHQGLGALNGLILAWQK